MALAAWTFYQHAGTASLIKEVSQALNVPRAPLYLYFALSCGVSAIVAIITTFGGFYKIDTHQADEELL